MKILADIIYFCRICKFVNKHLIVDFFGSKFEIQYFYNSLDDSFFLD